MKTLIKLSLLGIAFSTLSACSNVDNAWCPPEKSAILTVKEETHILSVDALFKFDQFTLSAVLPGDKDNLDKFISSLKDKSPRIASITVIGHTDRLGTDSYNDKLGLQRAETIKAYLISEGISSPINTQSQGKRQPVTTNCSGYGEKLRACLQPDRRIEVKIAYK